MTTFAAAVVGTGWLAGWLVATAALALYAVLRRGPQRPLLAVLFFALAAGAPVAARLSGLAEALAVLGLVACYDAAAYVVGTGAHNRWEGPAAGIATVVAGALLVAALAVPPFTLLGVALLAVIVSLAGAFGPALTRFVVEPTAAEHRDADDDEAGAPEEAPAVRRLSTLLAASPALFALMAYTAMVN